MLPIKIIVVDDHKLFRQTLIGNLSELNFNCIDEAGNGFELLEILKKKQPDVILLDIDMPEMDGGVAFEKIRVLYPGLKIIILTMHNENALIEYFYSLGAKAFLSKSADIELVVDTITAVHHNTKLPSCVIESQKRATDEKIRFSKRESEVTKLICEGKSNKEIAEELNIVNKTVEAHKKKLFMKTKTHSSVSFVNYILKKGLNFLK